MITILGPTASGKTILAANVAARINAEVINADSRQVYRNMNIGTGKDYEDYKIGDTIVPYHLIDIVDPGYEFNIFEYTQAFQKALSDIEDRGKFPILCGGSGLYIEAILKSYDLLEVNVDDKLRSSLNLKSDKELIQLLESFGPLHNKTDITDRQRLIRAIEIRTHYAKQHKDNVEKHLSAPLVFGIMLERSQVRERITHRLRERLANGMLEEVQQLLDSGLQPEQLIFYGLEYKFITKHLIGELRYDEMFNLLNTAIHQYAKRQMTWFRRMEKRGIPIQWIDGNLSMEEKLVLITERMM